ncbi:MAG: hypothetical protein HUJ55_01120 [Ileibacterium sp.]|nr:hypothetical protein [Ileibacterium sp.]
MNKTDVLMVLPKRIISAPAKLLDHWEMDLDSNGITIYTQNELLGHAMVVNGSEFGMERPSLKVAIHHDDDELHLFEAMISRLAVVYEQVPSRYPLYIRLSSKELRRIAKASRMGFIPYFGEWKESSRKGSEASWEEITGELRKAFPKGLEE